MIDIDLYKGISQFGAYGRMLENDVHAYGSVDRVLFSSMIKLCDKTKDYLYNAYTPVKICYKKGTRPKLEDYVHEIIKNHTLEDEKIEAITRFCSSLGDKIGDCDIEELVFGGTEEEIIMRGSYWCADLSRVGAIMFQTAGFPSRIISLFNMEHAYNGHVINEVYRNGLWGAVDTTRGVVYKDRNGKPLSLWDLYNNHNLIKMHYLDDEDIERKVGQFSACSIYNYSVNDFEKYDYITSKVNSYYRALLNESEKVGWRNLKWIFGEDENNYFSCSIME